MPTNLSLGRSHLSQPREWTNDTETPIRALAVYSDAHVGERRKPGPEKRLWFMIFRRFIKPL